MTLNSLTKYGTLFQVKVISGLLTHKPFLQNVYDVLDVNSFDNPAHKWIIENVLKYYDKYHTNPSMDVLHVEVKKVENDILRVSIIEQLKEAYRISEEDLKYVEEEFLTFCKNQQLKQALLSSVDLLNAGNYDDIRRLIDGALRAGQDKNIGHEYLKDIETRYRKDSRIIVPTPWPTFNDLINGGLGNGDFGLIFGNPGGGKSWCLIALGAHAVMNGYNVLHYTLELGEAYVGKRYDAYFTNISFNKIDDCREEVEKVITELPGKLIIKEYSPGRASISTLEGHIRKSIDLGVKPDLIIIDYVDLLSTRKRTKERKEEIDDIYLSTKGLAKELQVPVWSVSQVNRAGAKDDIIEGDKAAGSYDKIMIADLALSLSRKKKDKVDGTGRFHIMKNRYGMDGMTFGADIDTSTGHIEIKGEYNEDEDSSSSSKSQPINNIDKDDRNLLKQKFFELKLS